MSVDKIIARAQEVKFLNRIWQSQDAEFVAIYGRRRVGKTHLIREFFGDKELYFELTGLKDGSLKDQLTNFWASFIKTFKFDLALKPPDNWRDAFEILTYQIKKVAKTKKIVIFFDELPWLATKRSKLIQNLDYYWNTEWSKLNNLKLFVCGSAAAWMLENLINAKGGLYNRLTSKLLLEPFDLAQTKQYLAHRKIKFNNQQIIDLYLILGGIPHYLNQVNKSLSIIQNINAICFTKNGLLIDEFPRLFKSLYDNPDLHFKIIKTLAKYRYGIDATKLAKDVGKSTGGGFTKILQELIAAGFIQKFVPIGKQKRDVFYRIVDEYTYFYLNWIEEYQRQGSLSQDKNYWQLKTKTQSWQSWSGFAFELLCFKHIANIKSALGLEHILCKIGNLRQPSDIDIKSGAQIDLVIDRDDGLINICEIKFSKDKIKINKQIALNLLNKLTVFEKVYKSNKKINLVLITTHGLEKNSWSDDLIDNLITADDFFN